MNQGLDVNSRRHLDTILCSGDVALIVCVDEMLQELAAQIPAVETEPLWGEVERGTALVLVGSH